MSTRTPIRHGEILLLPVDSAPDGDIERVTTRIVGHSESGHHHVLDSDREFTCITGPGGVLFVDLDAPTPLRHLKDTQQHREIQVPPGVWKVKRKTEFNFRAKSGRARRRREVVD